MAEHPELWTERTPERRHLFDRAPAFGSAGDAERMPERMDPALTSPNRRKRRRERGPFLTYLCLPWSYGDRDTVDLWHRLQCRRRRHEMRGGDTMQLGSTLIFMEWRCRWCGSTPESPS